MILGFAETNINCLNAKLVRLTMSFLLIGTTVLTSSCSDGLPPKEGVPRLWEKLKLVTQPCDRATSDLDVALQRGGRSLNSYEAAKQAAKVCEQSWWDMKPLSAPDSLPSEVEQQFDDALGVCTDAYFAKYRTMQETAAALDGSMTYAQLSQVKELGEASSSGVILCTLGFVAAAKAAGVELPDTGPEEKTEPKAKKIKKR